MDVPQSQIVTIGAVSCEKLVSLPVEPSITYKPILDEKRSTANRRERNRVDTLRKGFSNLRNVVPKDLAEPELTRMDVVNRAGEYIEYLSDLLETADANPEEKELVYDDRKTNMNEVHTCFIDCKVEEKSTQILPEKRVKCNRRARDRSRRTKDAFDSLKVMLPILPAEPELSRKDILCRASEYIAVMTKMLVDDAETTVPPRTEIISESSGFFSSEPTSCGPNSVSCPPASMTAESEDGNTSMFSTNNLKLSQCSPLSSNFFPQDSDSDYGSMSPPLSAASECSFTFPPTSDSTCTTGSCTTTTSSCIQTCITSTTSTTAPATYAMAAVLPPPPPYGSVPVLNIGGGCIRSRRARSASKLLSHPYATTTAAIGSSPVMQCSSDSSYSPSTVGELASRPPITPLTPFTPLTRFYFNLVAANNHVPWSPRLATRVCGSMFQPIPSAAAMPTLRPETDPEALDLDHFLSQQMSGGLNRQCLDVSLASLYQNEEDLFA